MAAVSWRTSLDFSIANSSSALRRISLAFSIASCLMKAVIFFSSPATWQGEALAAVDAWRGALRQARGEGTAYLVVGEGVDLRHGGGRQGVRACCGVVELQWWCWCWCGVVAGCGAGAWTLGCEVRSSVVESKAPARDYCSS